MEMIEFIIFVAHIGRSIGIGHWHWALALGIGIGHWHWALALGIGIGHWHWAEKNT